MTRQLHSKVRHHRSQQTTGNVIVTFPEQNVRRSKPANRFVRTSVQHVTVNSRSPQRYYDEFMVVEREKQAQTGRWVLNVIAANEAYKQAMKTNNDSHQTNTKQSSNKKKHSFQSRKSSKIEPIEQSSSQLTNTAFQHMHIINNQNQNINQLSNHSMLTPTTIEDRQMTPMSSFSSAVSIDRVRTPKRSSISSRTKSNSGYEDYSTDEFTDNEEKPCIPKRMVIVCTILSVILIIGIIVAVFITIFVGRNQSTSSNAKILDPKSLLVPLSTNNGMICPTEMFNITDPLCNGQVPYNYYSCYQIATSATFTIQFALQHDTVSGHWYFDDINAIQNDNIQLIINGGFESNLTGWIINSSSNATLDTYVDTTIGLAHTGSGYLYGASKNYPAYIQQTFNVTEGEYINVSFWWGYDGGLKIGSTCEAIGQLIPSL